MFSAFHELMDCVYVLHTYSEHSNADENMHLTIVGSSSSD